MSNYYLGFDGGGTKTECVLLDAEGAILGEGKAGPSNPLRAGFEAAHAALETAASMALASANIPAQQVQALCAGLAGAGRPRVVKRVMAFLVEQFPGADVQVTTDSEVALEAAAGGGEGVILIAGTGSIAFGRAADGRTARAGGVGPWLGDEGSAFDMGRRALVAVARARDGLGPVTMLSDTVPPALDCPNWDRLTERIAEAPDEVFPRVFPLILEAAQADDAIAKDVLARGALGLARLASSVVKRLDLREREFPLAKAGGVHGHLEFFDQMVDALLSNIAPRARIGPLPVPPAVGAAHMAIRLSRAPRPDGVTPAAEAFHG